MVRIPSLIAIDDPVLRAIAANELLWNGHPGSTDLRATRGQAIYEAIEAGRAAEEIAEQLHVRPDDLAWMSTHAELAGPAGWAKAGAGHRPVG
ncbi:MAG: hypothetical protein ACQSGP_17075 [Frankia sp.]